MTQTPVERLWRYYGCPEPIESDGTAIRPRDQSATCAITGLPGAAYLYDDAFSANFTLPRLAGVAFPYRSDPSTSVTTRHGAERYAVHAAGVFAAKTILFRCCSWILEPGDDGDILDFWPMTPPPKDEGAPAPGDTAEKLAAKAKSAAKRAGYGRMFEGKSHTDWLDWLLAERPAGTVAAIPRYGIDHGGEANAYRCAIAGQPTPSDPLIKLQAKHVAIYAQASTSRGGLALQVDDDTPIDVRVDDWRRIVIPVRDVLRALIAAGLTEYRARLALSSMTCPPGQSARIAAILVAARNTFAKYITEPFWPIFAGAIYP